MNLELQYKINANEKFHRFLHENSYWYKELNRDPSSFKAFVNDMKDKYELKPSDKINKALNNIGMLEMFLDVLK